MATKVKAVPVEKEWKVYVYYHPATKTERELWLGYTQHYNDRAMVTLVMATTRAKAIAKAIKLRKEAKGAL